MILRYIIFVICIIYMNESFYVIMTRFFKMNGKIENRGKVYGKNYDY